ncbi:MAG TPA: DUF2249 domain-containing protein [Trueperaceae bacterium]|nr:DUF2249 domain-containing protein [Trueperaceae bacterium]
MRQAFLDNRGLEPPNPMIRTLEKLDELDKGDVLTIHNDRVPIYLLPQLNEMGALYQVAEQSDGSAIVTITKGSGTF